MYSWIRQQDCPEWSFILYNCTRTVQLYKFHDLFSYSYAEISRKPNVSVIWCILNNFYFFPQPWCKASRKWDTKQYDQISENLGNLESKKRGGQHGAVPCESGSIGSFLNVNMHKLGCFSRRSKIVLKSQILRKSEKTKDETLRFFASQRRGILDKLGGV